MSSMRTLAFTVALIALGAFAQVTPANAEEPTVQPAPPAPRAAPVARGFVASTYAPSFSTLIDQAVVAAKELTADARRARGVVVERATVENELIALEVRASRPGAVADRLQRQALLLSSDPAAVPSYLSQDEREAVAQMRELRAGLERYRTALVAEQEALTRAGVWTLPSGDSPWIAPLAGEITQTFGPSDFRWEPARSVDGVFHPHYHDGIDVAAEYGTPIVAPAAGQVIFAGHLADGARVVLIAHIGGYVSEYGHLEDAVALPVAAGDMVRAGQAIGRVGMSGMTTGPHLHLQVWHGGALIDPASLISAYR